VCGAIERRVGTVLGNARTPERSQLADLLEQLATPADQPV
jgi:hypothetical protein